MAIRKAKRDYTIEERLAAWDTWMHRFEEVGPEFRAALLKELELRDEVLRMVERLERAHP
jgi:hypothetical protein